ncbi:MAG: hypothetical protein KTQ49_06360, partial [Candidatus Omnitrophica bacterium]|nr:hypothetical protein [Candidatus Omnitrophota bacterium]
GVYLPLDQLFSLDFKEAIMSGKVTDMESLFRPTDEAVEKVEDLLFSMSRVMLSTDKTIRFYFLQATDIEKSGMELSFLGNIEDVKRVRFWDIPRSEYRKRVIHDIRLNQAALWHQPVRRFFRDLNVAPKDVLQSRYFPRTEEQKWAKEFFFIDRGGRVTSAGQAVWEVLDLRSLPVQDNEVVVYAKVKIGPGEGRETVLEPKSAEYLFQILVRKGEGQIRRIIPLAYLDEHPDGLDASFTREAVSKSLPQWETEFRVPDIRMGDFLSRQLTRRLQGILAEDERINNTFLSVKPLFTFDDGEGPSFWFQAVAPLKDARERPYAPGENEIHEDVLYLWKLAAREFTEVLRSYDFKDYRFLNFEIDSMGEPTLWKASREDLELFRRNRKDLRQIIVAS